jgi:MYXO-CTERM domain-containing protein
MPSNRSLRRFRTALAASGFALAAWPAFAAEYYVAPTGVDSNPGTMAAPFATLQKGHDVAGAGDTVWIRGGTYSIVTPRNSGAGIALTKSGTSDANRIKYWAYPGERPVFDFSRLAISTTGYTAGFSVSGSFVHLKGLEIKNVPMNTRSNNGISASGSNNIFELLDLHHISGTGLFIHAGDSTGGNLVLNSDAHDNYDPTSSQGAGQNADGFGVHYQETGAPTIIRGCRAWWNSDDGYDLISQEVPVIIENSWAIANGYIDSGMGRPASGNGTGFKAGSSKTGIRHVIRNCLAARNRANGFYANHSSGGNDWYNNTSYQNGTQYNMLASTWDAAGNRTDGVMLTGARAHRMRNNIGFPNDNTYIDGYGVDNTFNSWNVGITPAASDFVSVDDSGVMGPRQADGSLPNLAFMKLSATSRFLDKGTNVGLPYAGTAPDLGCYEAGLPSGGAGGGAGMGGGGTSVGGSGAAAGSGAAGSGAVGGSGGSGVGGASVGGTSAGGGVSTGGATATGGATTGGATATGGATSAGSGPGAGTSSLGGAGSATGGASTSGSAGADTAGSGGSSDASSDEPSEDAPCGCRSVGRGNGSRSAALVVLVLGALAARRRRSQSER